jgi:hypothetical protein
MKARSLIERLPPARKRNGSFGRRARIRTYGTQQSYAAASAEELPSGAIDGQEVIAKVSATLLPATLVAEEAS